MKQVFRLGFPVKILGTPGIKSHDSRRWQSNPHLRVSLEHLNVVFHYLEENGLSMSRMCSDLAPYATHPDLPQFHNMIRESARELRETGDRARALGLRLSFHPSQYVVLNSTDEALVGKSMCDVESQSELLDAMGLGPEAVAVIHVGGVYGDRRAGCERWVRAWERLSSRAQSRLVLEHDDLRYGPADVLWIHERTGVRLIFDYQHFWCFNPEGMAMDEAFRAMLRTWPANTMPKIHYSSPRTELREKVRKSRKTGKNETVLVQPLSTQHADFVNPFEFATFIRTFSDDSFDIMLESKSKDLALFRLRRDLARYAPDVAERFGIAPNEAALAGEEEELEEVLAS